MRRLAESRPVGLTCVALALAGLGWGLVTSRWTADWLTEPHHRATVEKCETFHEVPATEDPRRCFSDTADGLLYIYGAGQGDVGDEFSYVLTDNKVRQQPGRALPPDNVVPFAPTTTDYVFLAVAVTTVLSALLGLAAIACSALRRQRGSNRRQLASSVHSAR